jgi:replicative DNA helicase
LTELADQFRAGSDQERVGELAARCKRLAQRLGVTVVLLSQLNREAEGRSGCMPYLSDLRSSGRIEEVADVVSLLYRRSYYSNKGMVDVNPTLDFFNETGFENVQVIVAKNRNGATGTLNLGWDPRPMRFVESWERSAA